MEEALQGFQVAVSVEQQQMVLHTVMSRCLQSSKHHCEKGLVLASEKDGTIGNHWKNDGQTLKIALGVDCAAGHDGRLD